MKINKLKLIFIGMTSIFFSLACEKETIVPINLEDKVFSFSEDIQPILDKKCINCHSKVITKGDSYNDLLENNWITTDASKVEDSKMYEKINGSHDDGRITEVEKRSLELWMEQGAENN